MTYQNLHKNTMNILDKLLYTDNQTIKVRKQKNF